LKKAQMSVVASKVDEVTVAPGATVALGQAWPRPTTV
jgi:hypothetical protein